MRIYKNEGSFNIFLGGKTVEQVNPFKDLESIVTWNGSCTEKIGSSRRICMDKRVFEKVKELLTARRMPFGISKKSAHCFI